MTSLLSGIKFLKGGGDGDDGGDGGRRRRRDSMSVRTALFGPL